MPEPPAGSRRPLLAALKLAVTVGLLAWLLGRVDLQGLGASLAQASPPWILAALALHFVGIGISAVRWQLLLRAQGAGVPLAYLGRSLLVGIFFNNFLPSTVGGDLMRARDTSAHAGSGTGALTVVMVERLSGILVLGFFVFLAPLAGSLRGEPEVAGVGAAAALLAGSAVFFLLLRPAPLARARGLLARRLQPAAGEAAASGPVRLDRLLATLESLSRSPRVLLWTFALAFLLQANVILHFWCVARSLRLDLGLPALLLIIPVATVLLLLPVSINGIGAREAVFAFLLGRHGVPLAPALAFCWISFATVLVQALLGGLIYAARPRA